MLEISFVSSLVETIYGFSPVAIESIQQYGFDWRGIFCVYAENGQRWVLRLLKHPNAAKDFRATAELLNWLNQQRYPVPRIRQTRDKQFVGLRDNWALLLTSFLEGEVITPEPANLKLLSARLGQLHVLTLDSAPNTRHSRCHPETIADFTVPQLRAGSLLVSPTYALLFKSLIDSMSALIEVEELPVRMTHGDCWYMNAVKTDTDRVELIDWDNIGLGLSVFDLGYLLLSSHFRLDDPYSIEPDQSKIQAIMEGYQQHYPLRRQEVNALRYAVYFPLAYHLGMYCENNASLQEDDLFLVKTQQRFKKAAEIAQIAEAYALGI